MLALLMWLLSGLPLSVLAPSVAWASTASWSTASKLLAARVKPIGAAARWSWNLPRKYSSWTASCARLVRHEFFFAESQPHGCAVAQFWLAAATGLKGYAYEPGAAGPTSSAGPALSSSSTSL